MIHAVIIAADGTVVDSSDAHARAWVEALAEHRHEVAFERVRWLLGTGGERFLPEVVGSNDATLGAHIERRRWEIFRIKHIPELQPFPGVGELLRRLYGDGLTLVAASAARGEDAARLLGIAGVSGLISEAVAWGDAAAGGEITTRETLWNGFSNTLRTLDLLPDNVMLLAATPFDVLMARRMGLRAVALRSGGWSDYDLADAVALYDDAADLLASYEDCPLVRGGQPPPVRRRRRRRSTERRRVVLRGQVPGGSSTAS